MLVGDAQEADAAAEVDAVGRPDRLQRLVVAAWEH